MGNLIRVLPVVPATSLDPSDLHLFISVVNYYENALVMLTIAHDEAEAERFIQEMKAKAYEKDAKHPELFAEPGKFDSWWKRKYTHDLDLLYSVDQSKPGVYIFRAPDVDIHFR